MGVNFDQGRHPDPRQSGVDRVISEPVDRPVTARAVAGGFPFSRRDISSVSSARIADGRAESLGPASRGRSFHCRRPTWGRRCFPSGTRKRRRRLETKVSKPRRARSFQQWAAAIDVVAGLDDHSHAVKSGRQANRPDPRCWRARWTRWSRSFCADPRMPRMKRVVRCQSWLP